jgi:hypothetical protein
MQHRVSVVLALVLSTAAGACAASANAGAGAGAGGGVAAGTASGGRDTSMSFFLTSAGPGDGANLGGVAGADAHCQRLAEAAGVRSKTWRAYLSSAAAAGQAAMNARDRIGAGPWYNARGLRVAANVAELHSEASRLGKQGSLTERGDSVNGRGDTPNRHDVLTGSLPDGTAYPDAADHTCGNWTRSDSTGSAQVGHHDRQGGGERPNSWNSAHASRGCGQANLRATGGDGLFYCFAR